MRPRLAEISPRGAPRAGGESDPSSIIVILSAAVGCCRLLSLAGKCLKDPFWEVSRKCLGRV